MKMHVPLGKPQPWVLPMTIVCLVFGGVIAGLTSAITEDQGVDTSQMNREQLVTLYTQTSQEMKGLKKENDDLRDQLSTLQNSAIDGTKLQEALRRQINDLRVQSGATPVVGPGILITLDDTGNVKSAPSDPQTNLRVVHDSDLYILVNELRAVRAEAIEINGLRVTASTAIRCAGPAIQVNETVVTPPFRIAAIGKPDTLFGAVNLPGGNLEWLRSMGIRVQVDKRDRLLIAAAKLISKLEYARPVLEEESAKAENQQ